MEERVRDLESDADTTSQKLKTGSVILTQPRDGKIILKKEELLASGISVASHASQVIKAKTGIEIEETDVKAAHLLPKNIDIWPQNINIWPQNIDIWPEEFWPPPEGMVPNSGPPPEGMDPNFEPKNDLKKGQICVFGWFLGPNEPFRLFSHHILCPTGLMKE